MFDFCMNNSAKEEARFNKRLPSRQLQTARNLKMFQIAFIFYVFGVAFFFVRVCRLPPYQNENVDIWK